MGNIVIFSSIYNFVGSGTFFPPNIFLHINSFELVSYSYKYLFIGTGQKFLLCMKLRLKFGGPYRVHC